MYQAVRLEPSSRSTSTRDDVESNFLPSQEEEEDQHEAKLAYKPFAIRLPCLLLYFAILAICVGLIEWVLSETELPKLSTSSSSSSSSSLLSSSPKPRTILARQYVNNTCASADTYSSQLQNVLSVSSSLCIEYSATYAPYANSLPPSLQTAFPSWSTAINRNLASQTQLSSTLTSCGARSTFGPDDISTTVFYAGCTAWTTTAATSANGCGTVAVLELLGETMIYSTLQTYCYAVIYSKSLLSLGSQSTAPFTTPTSSSWKMESSVQAQNPTSLLELTSQSQIQDDSSKSFLGQTSQSQIQNDPGRYTLVADSSTFVYSYTPAIQPGQKNTGTLQPPITSSLAIFSLLQPTSQPVKATSSAQPVKASSSAQSVKGSTSPAQSVKAPSSAQASPGPTSSGHTQIDSAASSSNPTKANSQNPGTVTNGVLQSSVQPSSAQQIGAQSTSASSTVRALGQSEIPQSNTQIHSPAVTTSYSTVVPGQTIARTVTGTVLLSNSKAVPTVVTLYSIYSGTSLSVATVVITDTASLEALATYSSAANPTATVTQVMYPVAVKYASTDVIVKSTFKHSFYFAALYLAPILAVIIKALWEIIAASLKMMEPFQRMNNKSGATAKYSILAQYLSSILSLDAFRALSYGHLQPLWTLATYLLVVVGAPIASISMTVVTAGQCTMTDGSLGPCDPRWVVHKPIVRVLEGGLVICMVLAVCFMWSTRKSYIAVATNPSSIASIASLMNHRPLVQDLEVIDPLADEATFALALEKHLFKLDAHQTRTKAYSRYGIIGTKQKNPSLPEPFEGAWLRGLDVSENTAFMTFTDDGGPRPVRPELNPVAQFFTNPRSKTLLIDILHCFTTLSLLALVVTYAVDYNYNDRFNRFFNSKSSLPEVILVGLATIVDIQTKNLERVIRINEPFRRLARRNARPETTILLSLNGTCWSNLPQCIYLLFAYEFANGRMLWQSIVTVVTALSDFNIIATAGIPFTDAQTHIALYVCAYTSITITSCILAINLVTMLWWRRSEVIREMPRQPETIGVVMSYLCSSELVREWMDSQSSVTVERLGPNHLAMLVRGEGRRYFFGKVPGMDGRERWCIDIDSWRDEKEARSRASAYIS